MVSITHKESLIQTQRGTTNSTIATIVEKTLTKTVMLKIT